MGLLKVKNNLKKIGLAISGAGVLGTLEVGACKCLDEFGFSYSKIVGTSAGSITGSLLALGFSVDDMEKIVLEANFEKLIPYNYLGAFIKGYLASNKNVTAWLKDITSHAVFGDCKIPFVAITSDIQTGSVYIFDSTSPEFADIPIWQGVLASMSIPDVFPVFQDKFVDGGVLNNLGVNFLDRKSPNIALKVVDGSGFYKPGSLIGLQERLIGMLLSASENDMVQLAKAYNIPIIPLNSHSFGFLDRSMSLSDKKMLIQWGYYAVKNNKDFSNLMRG